MPVTKNIVTDYSMPTDGTSDARPAFLAMRNALQGQDVILDCPPITHLFGAAGSNDDLFLFKGLNSIEVRAPRATFDDNAGVGGFQFGGPKITDITKTARVETVVAGSRSVVVKSHAKLALFQENTWARMGGLDLQGIWQGDGIGDPPNHHYFEYVFITDINEATDTITFSAPLKYGYKSTWPLYDAGGGLGPDQGGPATLYQLDPSWNMEVAIKGATIVRANVPTYAVCRSILYQDAVHLASSGSNFGFIPSQNLLYRATNVQMANTGLEVDKLNTEIILQNVLISVLEFQSSSTDILRMHRSVLTTSMQGTPKRAIISESTIPLFRPGAWVAGRSDEVVCIDCAIETVSPHGLVDKGVGEAGINAVDTGYTMSGGVITVPNSRGPAQNFGAVGWAVPGTRMMWQGQFDNETTFTVVDVTQDATNTYIETDLAGGFPDVPLTSGKLFVQAHSAPRCTFINCTGTAGAALSRAPAGKPIYESFDSGPLTKADSASPPSITLWGDVSSVTVAVGTAYAGAGALTMGINLRVIKPDNSSVLYSPTINLKVAGTRTITLAGITGTQSGDANLALPSGVSNWAAGGVSLNFSADVSGEATSLAFSIQAQTDQGIDNPRTVISDN